MILINLPLILLVLLFIAYKLGEIAELLKEIRDQNEDVE